MYLGSLILACGDEVGPVGGPLQIDDGLLELVNRDVVDQLTSLSVVLAHAAILMTSDNVLVKVAPSSNRSLALVANNRQSPLIGLRRVYIGVDLKDDDVGQVTHALLGDTKQLGAVLVELDTLNGGGELPGLQALSGLDVPETDGVVGGTGGDHGRGRVDVDGPDGTDMAVVGTEALAVVGVPSADVLILCDGEDDVAIEVITFHSVSISSPRG